MNKIEKQILVNQLNIISALETLLIDTKFDVSNSYGRLDASYIDTITLIDEERKK